MAKTKQPDLIDALEKLPSLEGYTEMDRYRDFRKVFGSTEGKRVLKEVLSWGRMFKSPIFGNPIDPYAMALAMGERNMALKLFATVMIEPVEKPIQQTRKKI